MKIKRCCLYLLLMMSTSCVAVERNRELAETVSPVQLQSIEVDGFWKPHYKRLTEKWIPHCIKEMQAGGRGQELVNIIQAGRVLKGEDLTGKYTGAPWSDAYIYNTIEAASLALTLDPGNDQELKSAQAALRAKIDEWIPIILASQHPDGYIHSFHTVNKRERYSNLHHHEFYVMGYFLEMGIAHYRANGGRDRRLYDAARKCADHLCDSFGPPPKKLWIHGHPGMGYALCRLARAANETEGPGKGDRYFELAKYLLDNRHECADKTEYMQTHRPVVEMENAVGHAVRATYFYTAMTDLAMLCHDPAYWSAVQKIWDSAIQRKHYITGGVGASAHGEAFAADFHLPNDGYCESCASCGMVFWADRMHRIDHNAHYHDVLERVVYNNQLGSIDLKGENFYYQNPLEAGGARYPWHGCPCCVGNIPRTLLGFKDQLYARNLSGDTLYINHFMDSNAVLDDSLSIAQKTGYPWKGDVTVTVQPKKPVEMSVKVRIPDRAESRLYTAEPDLGEKYTLKVNGKTEKAALTDGYATIKRKWKSGDRITLELPLDVQRVHCDARVEANQGRVAFQRGPIVYNFESVDNGDAIEDLVIKPDVQFSADWREDLLGGVMTLKERTPNIQHSTSNVQQIQAIPNFVRLNRGGFSQVWMIEDPARIKDPHVLSDELKARMIDRVKIGRASSEQDHQLGSERSASGSFNGLHWRDARDGGWFSYSLKVNGDAKNTLLVRYWGSEGGRREFDILVDGEKIGEQKLLNNQPDKFFDVEYAIPEKLTKGKEQITVKFQAHPGAMAGGIFDLMVVK